jgi:hypothetical protein
MAIRCMHCARVDTLPTDTNIPAAATREEFEQETRESKPVVQQ